MTERTATVAICDAGPLIHLDELGCIDLLAEFSRVIVPAAVWEEAAKHRPEFWRVNGVAWERASPTSPLPAEIETLARLLALHQGEKEALRVAHERRGGMLLSDDTAARLAAKHLGLPVHGTLGLLIRAIRCGRKRRAEVVELLRSVPTRSSLHIKRAVLQGVIAQVERAENA